MISRFKIASSLIRMIGVLAWVYFSYLMVLITLQYIPIDTRGAFLRIKQNEIQLFYYPPAFFIHVYTSIFTLLLGGVQFSTFFRERYRMAHRVLGKIYILLILFLAAPSGFIMGYHANGGLSAQISFCLMALLWIIFTYKAYHQAIHQNWKAHQKWMLRSYALTLSAISLRLFKWIIVNVWVLPPRDTYQIVAWAGWVVNLILVESWILYRLKSHPKNSLSAPL